MGAGGAAPPPPGPRAVLRGLDAEGRALAWLHGRALVAGDAAGACRAWDPDLETGGEIRDGSGAGRGLLPAGRAFVALRAAGEGGGGSQAHFVAQDSAGDLRLWQLRGEAGGPEGAAAVPAGPAVAAGTFNLCRAGVLGGLGAAALGADAAQVGVWELASGAEAARLGAAAAPGGGGGGGGGADPPPGMCMALRLVPSPKTGLPLVLAAHEGGAVRLWDLRRADKPLVRQQLFAEPAMSLACAERRGRLVAVVGSAEGRLAVLRLDASEGTCTVQREAETAGGAGLGDAAIRPDGRVFATAGWDGKVRVFGLPRGEPLAVLRHHSGAAAAVEFSPCSRLLASAGGATVALWGVFPPREPVQEGVGVKP